MSCVFRQKRMEKYFEKKKIIECEKRNMLKEQYAFSMSKKSSVQWYLKQKGRCVAIFEKCEKHLLIL